jgi:hypothetical protein
MMGAVEQGETAMEGVTGLAQSPTGMTDSELYEHDFPAWCELQASRLRLVAAGVTGRDPPDWLHLIEEIADMGAAERHRVESLLTQAMMHLIKLNTAPGSENVAHWAIEIRVFLRDARRHYAPSMRQRLDLDDMFGDATFQAEGRRTGVLCPYSLDDLLAKSPDVEGLVAKLP